MKYKIWLKISVNLLCVSHIEWKINHLFFSGVNLYISFISHSALTVLLWSIYRGLSLFINSFYKNNESILLININGFIFCSEWYDFILGNSTEMFRKEWLFQIYRLLQMTRLKKKNIDFTASKQNLLHFPVEESVPLTRFQKLSPCHDCS